jgi:bifunctional non-homologous end joining protein LigD
MAERNNLETYRKKRDFRRTSEPPGGNVSRIGNLFMIHKHDASRLHYDLRLQIGDVLKSWAVPKGPSLDPAERRFAAEVEDHPLEYGGFEGVIPEGQYGAGPTLIWDRGAWAPMGDIEQSLKAGTLKFRLAGEKLKGGWTLVRMKRRAGETKNSWLLIKEPDDAARTDGDILEERPESVLSGKRIEELLAPGTRQWTTGKKAAREPKTKEEAKPATPSKPVELKPGALKGARKAAMPKTFKPQLASPVDEPPKGKEWLHEIKLDGYRTIALVSGGKTKLLTRNGHDWTDRYGDIAAAFSALPATDAVIDGEIVVPDEQGRTKFGALQDAIANGDTSKMIFYAFDLPHLDGFDISAVPLVQRKALLEKLVSTAVNDSSAIQLSEHVIGNGGEFFDLVSENALEGVVSKRADSAYFASTRTKTWLKAKAKRLESLTIVGFTTSAQAEGLAALLLADEVGDELRYIGKVGTGFSASEAASLLSRLERMERAKPAVVSAVPMPKEARWVEPGLKAKVQYSNRTAENLVRHAVYRGLREPEFAAPSRAAAPVAMKRYITDQHLASIWVTNPDRRMFSQNGPSKLDLAVFYAKVGDAVMPHLLNRPVSLVRCPSGKIEDCFFQRHAFSGMPPEVGTFELKRSNDEDRTYIYVKDAAGFLALAQYGVVEFHPWGCRVDKPEKPDRMFFDLDPGEGVPWREVKRAAHLVHQELTGLKLTPFVKTSGKKGIHIVVPIKRLYSWKELHEASGRVAVFLAKKFPDTFTAMMGKAQRKKLIFLDFHRNARSATAVGVYSVRAVKGLPVSMPVSWENLDSIDDPADLNYSTVPGILTNSGDPWADMDASAASFGAEIGRLSK